MLIFSSIGSYQFSQLKKICTVFDKYIRTCGLVLALIMDKFVQHFKTAEEAVPLVWKTSPLPKSKPKRPVGRPPKRKLSDVVSGK